MFGYAEVVGWQYYVSHKDSQESRKLRTTVVWAHDAEGAEAAVLKQIREEYGPEAIVTRVD